MNSLSKELEFKVKSVDNSIFQNLSSLKEIDEKFNLLSKQASKSISSKYNLVLPKNNSFINKTPKLESPPSSIYVYTNSKMSHHRYLSSNEIKTNNQRASPQMKKKTKSFASTMKPTPSPLSSVTNIRSPKYFPNSIMMQSDNEIGSQPLNFDDYIVNYFAMLIDILVNSSEEEVEFKSNLRIIQTFMTDFNVSIDTLRAIKGAEDKKKYIITTIGKSLDLEIKEQKIRLKNKDIISKTPKNIIQEKFNWLEIKTKYPNLANKIRSELIQNLDADYGENSSGKINHMTQSVVEKYNNPPSIKPIIKDMAVGFKNQFLEKSLENDEIEFNWDDQMESDFKNRRKDCKKLFKDNVKSSSFSEVALLSFVQDKIRKRKNLMKRDNLLQSYSEGAILKPKELRYIEKTSELLNSCLDKKFISSTVKTLDEEIKSNLEAHIAENTIHSYKSIRNSVKSARSTYLKDHRDIQAKHIWKNWNKLEKDLILEKSRLTREMFLKKIKKFLSTYEKKREKQFNQLTPFQKSQINNPFVKNVLRIAREIKKRFRGSKNKAETERTNKVTENISLPQKSSDSVRNLRRAFSSHTLNELRHKFHPSSKVFLATKHDKKSSDLTSDKINDINRNQEIQKRVYEIKLKSSGTIRSKERFVKFNSGGPSKPRESLINPSIFNDYPEQGIIDNDWITKDIETKAATLIKAFFKRCIQYKKFKSSVEMNNILAADALKKKIRTHLAAKQLMSAFCKTSGRNPFQTDRSKATPEPTTRPEFRSASATPSKRFIRTNTSKAKVFKADNEVIREYLPLQFLLKHRNLFEALKKNSLNIATKAGWNYTKSDVNVIDESGFSPLYYACKYGSLKFVDFLLDHGALPNKVCLKGNTPLHMAFSTCNNDIVLKLIFRGGDLNIINEAGQTPLAFATEGYLKMIGLDQGVTTVKGKKEFDNNELLKKKSLQNPESSNNTLILNLKSALKQKK